MVVIVCRELPNLNNFNTWQCLNNSVVNLITSQDKILGSSEGEGGTVGSFIARLEKQLGERVVTGRYFS